MPIFDFKCEKCGKIEERLISRAQIELQKCICTDDSPMVKTEEVHATNFALKGVWFKSHKRY